jgi:hypothetical protein
VSIESLLNILVRPSNAGQTGGAHFNGIKTPDDGKKMKEPDSTKTAGHCYCLLLQIYLFIITQ